MHDKPGVVSTPFLSTPKKAGTGSSSSGGCFLGGRV